jgi:hypothetical protein
MKVRYGDTLVVVNAALVSGYGGQKVRDWDNATRITTPGSMQPDPRRPTEDINRRDTAETLWRCWLPPDVPIGIASRIEWVGKTYEVHGEPETWTSRGKPHHTEARLTRVVEAP